MIDENFKHIKESFENIQKLAEPQLYTILEEINRVIEQKEDSHNQLDHLFDKLLNMGFIHNIDAAFSRLYTYVVSIYPDLADDYLDYYNEYFNDNN